MFRLWSTIIKDLRILTRDKVGLTLMFLMPVVLTIVITSVQNGTFEMVNNNKVAIILDNRDADASAGGSASASRELVKTIEEAGMFTIAERGPYKNEQEVRDQMYKKEILVAVVIPPTYSQDVMARAQSVARKALKDISGEKNTASGEGDSLAPLQLLYHPTLQLSFRRSIEGALGSVLQVVQSKYIVKSLYKAINEENIPDSVESQIVGQQTEIIPVAVSRDGNRGNPNATQHNIPAWTVFAMFFIVISLGSSIVREKRSGSFLRLRTLPTHFGVAMVSKQITYILITLLQAVVIFGLGIFLFPHIGLPALILPGDITALVLVTLLCGWCATSFAICVGVYANTQEQANGFGAVSIVLLAAIGGLLVPSFAMPEGFRYIMKLSPLHWCMEAYYGLFLEGGKLGDILMNIIPLLVITLAFQVVAWWGLKRKRLV
ncbi:MAG: ABC transporter permease [Sphingobacteriales bacterium SCN 48-20]|jgi:ABC-2 type transport system permease protein|uniref:ABC transporter permease n=1 Tax=Terrimonas ferruginea TaxID=249 RepID=UPI00086D7E88|nr:ABC transporter permease [Terrimonas ferruginea]MBN8784524.1 ABC transporter permease [Terrimonas ferruginea]ODT92311.1 MAG: ABC transporter permease [Sphingobacteriales bacterium SCN 48-20]OJW40550.1 MAG: ABC transporter permease [Sphingobacteriales bacterium 48-107]